MKKVKLLYIVLFLCILLLYLRCDIEAPTRTFNDPGSENYIELAVQGNIDIYLYNTETNKPVNIHLQWNIGNQKHDSYELQESKTDNFKDSDIIRNYSGNVKGLIYIDIPKLYVSEISNYYYRLRCPDNGKFSDCSNIIKITIIPDNTSLDDILNFL